MFNLFRKCVIPQRTQRDMKSKKGKVRKLNYSREAWRKKEVKAMEAMEELLDAVKSNK